MSVRAKVTNQNGFSLVELMVVVAIIGILAGIGIPSMQKQIAKARQSEVKVHLSGIHTAEKAFYAEYNTYTSDFGAMGFDPEGKVRYNAGFSSADTTARLSPFGYTVAPSGVYMVNSAANVSALTEARQYANPTGTFNSSVYTALGGGAIYKGRTDIWRINETKNMVQVSNGID